MISGRSPLASVTCSDVRKSFGATQILHGVSIDIRDGEFVVLVGPSGCGKSTLLRMIAGLENITGGEIRIGDRVVNNVPPKERDIAMVFQNYALYPHMTVAANMGFSLKLRGAPKPEIDERVQGRRRHPRPDAAARALSRASSRAASASASPWAAPSCATRRCSCSTSRSPTSTPSCASQMRTEIKELHQRLEDHHHLRHPRPDRGHDHGRQDRGHARRHRRADRRAARALRLAGQPVRGRASSARRR